MSTSQHGSPAPSVTKLELDFEHGGGAAGKKIRPQSTIAQMFSDQLNDAFLINDDLDQLASNIEQKKVSVSYQSTELQLLEARIREAERELQEKQKRLGLSPSAAVTRRPPPGATASTGGYVVVEKTPSLLEQRRPSAASVRTVGSVGSGYDAPSRPPPPPPRGSMPEVPGAF